MFDRVGTKKPSFFASKISLKGFIKQPYRQKRKTTASDSTLDYLSEWKEAQVGFNNTLPVRICELYIDDIIVTGDTEDELLENVIKIFERFRQYNIKAKP